VSLALGTTLAAAAVGQPPPQMKEPSPPPGWARESPPARRDPDPNYTAFPDLKAPKVEKEVKGPGGIPRTKLVEIDPIALPPLPAAAADSPALRKVRVEQLHAGLAYLALAKDAMRRGMFTSKAQLNLDHVQMVGDVYLVGAGLEESPARRVPWYEARVRKFKELEQYISNRGQYGNDSRQQLYRARFRRLGAEADLLELNAKVGQPPKGAAPERPEPKPEPRPKEPAPRPRTPRSPI
jgi:hypothetical protein